MSKMNKMNKMTQTHSNNRRVMVVGLDGATFDLIRPWAAQGKLPTLSRLLEEGTWGVLRSVIPPLTMPAWASFLTGMLPGHHGLYSFLRRKPGSYDLTPFNASFLQSPDIGARLNRQGRRVALVNIPATYPPAPLDGLLVSGLETPGRNGEFTYPGALRDELLARFDYEIERPEKYTPGQESQFEAAVNRVEDKRLQATLWLMEQDDWDLFAVLFRGTDVLGHALWRFMDPAHPAHEPALAGRYGEALLRHYQKMDQAIAQISARLRPQDLLVLMSDHGFGPLHRDVYVDNVLAENGLLFFKRTPQARLRYLLLKLGLSPRNLLHLLGVLRLRNLTRKLLPQKTRIAVSTGMLMQNSVDWTRTQAYPLGGGGQIAINLKGREPQGSVEPGSAYERACEQVEQALRTLRDPATARPIVERVWRKQELYGDTAVPDLPDLYVEWVDDHYTDIGGVGYSREIISGPVRGRSGGHTMRGILLVKGPGIKRGHEITGAQLVDLAPTIMHLLGAAVPQGLDGRVLTGILEDGAAGAEIRYEQGDAAAMPASELHLFSDEETEIIEQRLQDLGYL